MLTRRLFNKAALSISSLWPAKWAVSKTKLNPILDNDTYPGRSEFFDIFTEVNFPQDQTKVQFPLDIIRGHDLSIVYTTLKSEQIGDYLLSVDMLKYSDKNKSQLESKLYKDATTICLSAAVDRGMIIHDHGKLDNHLIQLLRQCLRRNSGVITVHNIKNKYDVTDIFLADQPANIKKEIEVPTINYHYLSKKTYEWIKKYYIDKLKGAFPKDCSNLLIALSTKTNDFVRPTTQGIKYNWLTNQFEWAGNMACLNNKSILIGAY